MLILKQITIVIILIFSLCTNAQNNPSANGINMQEVAIEMLKHVIENIETWKQYLNNVAYFDPEKVAIDCLGFNDGRDCSVFIYQAMIAHKLIHTGQVDITQAETDAYHNVIMRMPQNCNPPNNCIAELALQNSHNNASSALNQIQYFDFDEMYQRIQQASPQESPMCHFVQLFYMSGMYTSQISEEDKVRNKEWFEDFAQRYNIWMKQKSQELSTTPGFLELQNTLNNNKADQAQLLRSICRS